MKTFEYKTEIFNFTKNDWVEWLNTQGSEGWELVCKDESNITREVCTFKREI